MDSDTCSICGRTYDTFLFKGGYICEDCIHYMKTEYQIDPHVRKKR